MKKLLALVTLLSFFVTPVFAEENEDDAWIQDFIANLTSYVRFHPVLYDDMCATPDIYIDNTNTYRGNIVTFTPTNDGSSYIQLALVRYDSPNNDVVMFHIPAESSTNLSLKPNDEVEIRAQFTGIEKYTLNGISYKHPWCEAKKVTLIDSQINEIESTVFNALEKFYKKKLYTVDYDAEERYLSISVDFETIRLSSDREYSFACDLLSAMKILKELHQDGSVPFDAFAIILRGGLVDQYGNLSDTPCYTASFSWDTLKKINFKGIDPRNLPDIADTWFLYPVFRN